MNDDEEELGRGGTHACPHCGTLIAACPEPCGLWDCAFHAHLGLPGPVGCATEDGVEYRQMVAESVRGREVAQKLDQLEGELRRIGGLLGVHVAPKGES